MLPDKLLMRYRHDLPQWDPMSQSDLGDQVALSSSQTLHPSKYSAIACLQ